MGRLGAVATLGGVAGLCAPAATSHAHAVEESAVRHALSHAVAVAAVPGWELAYAATRWITYSAVLLAAGGVLFFVFVHDRRGAERRLLAGVVAGAALVGALGTIAGVFLHASEITGRGGAVRDPDALLVVLGSPVGTSGLVRLGGLALLFLALGLATRGRGSPLALLGGGLAVLSFTLSGHTVTAEPRGLAVVADACHALAASVWFGGLVLLGLVLHRRRDRGDPVAGAAMVARFSQWATAGLLLVAVAGLALAWVEVRTVGALASTRYGWTLALKVAVVGAVILIGGYNKWWLVPAIQRAAPDGAAQAWRRLGWTVRVEALGLVAALAVTAVLVHEAPPRPHVEQPVDHAGSVEPDPPTQEFVP